MSDSMEWCTADYQEAASYDFVRFTLADIHGISRSKVIPRRHVADKLSAGITMCARTIYYNAPLLIGLSATDTYTVTYFLTIRVIFSAR